MLVHEKISKFGIVSHGQITFPSHLSDGEEGLHGYLTTESVVKFLLKAPSKSNKIISLD